MDFIKVKCVSEIFNKELSSIYPKEEIRNFIWIIFEHLLDFSKADLITKEEFELSDLQQSFCSKALDKLKVQTPIQHIIGYTEFFGLKFEVNSNVLIPRPETEELVKWVIDDCTINSPSILDIGTGSGCIPISLKKNIIEAKLSAWDISQEAIAIAKKNALQNSVEVNFTIQDALNITKTSNQLYDIIISNPPYIREQEKILMKDNVLSFEPHLALFVKDSDPLLFYRSIGQFAIKALQPEGSLYLEINESLGSQTCSLLNSIGFKDLELRKDLFGKHRMIKARLA